MKKTQLLLLGCYTTLLSLFSYSIVAQQRVIVLEQKDGTNFRVFDDLAVAFDSLLPNDNMYIPSGVYSLATPTIVDSNVSIYGAGYRLDSSSVTGITNLSGSSLNIDANLVSISGIRFNNITVKKNSSEFMVNSCSFSRAYLDSNVRGTISNSYTLGLWSTQAYSNRGNYPAYKVAVMVHNNIIRSFKPLYQRTYNTCEHLDGVIFKYNVFLGTQFAEDSKNLLFENNIFPISASVVSSYDNSVIPPLLISSNLQVIVGARNTNLIFRNNSFNTSNNLLLADQPDINGHSGNQGKVTFYGGAYPNAYSENFDFRVQSGPNFVGPYANGFNPLPLNPHFRSININSQTDSIGRLKVNIKVIAQP